MKENIPVSMYVARSSMLENCEESISSLLLLYGYDVSSEDIKYFIEGNPTELTINECKLIIGLYETYKAFLSEMSDRVNINTLSKLHSMVNTQVNYTSWTTCDGQIFKDYLETVCVDTDTLRAASEIFSGILKVKPFVNYNVLVAWFAIQIIANNSGYYFSMDREQSRKLWSILEGELQDSQNVEIKELFSSMLVNAVKSEICVKS